MKIRIKSKSIKDMLTENMFYIFNLLALMDTFFIDFKVGIAGSLIIAVLFVLNSGKKYLFTLNPFSVFFFVNIVSVIDYAFTGQNIVLYFAGVSYNLLPMLLFFIGRSLEKEKFDIYINKIFFSNIIIIAIGLAILVISRSYYFSIMDVNNNYGTYFRFGSYLSSLPFGSMCVATVGITIYKYFTNNLSKLEIALLQVLLTGLILNMQRGAILGTGIIVILCIPGFIRNSTRKQKFTLLFIIIIIMLGMLFITRNYISSGQMDYLKGRISVVSFSRVFTSRESQWDTAIEYFMKYPILGIGLGAAGNKAIEFGVSIVPDGNYYRILVELGIMGISCFVLSLAQCLKRTIHSDGYERRIIGAIIIAYCAHAIGSNVFDFFYSSYIFWFLLGYASKPAEKGKIV